MKTAPSYHGPDDVADLRVAIVAARFNAHIVDALVDGAKSALAAHGLAAEQRPVYRVPGAWELPAVAAMLSRDGRIDAVVALGCVIRGETSHYDVIVNESARGLMQVSVQSGMPVGNGVLACENEAQAHARAGGKEGNKGAEAALAALELAALARTLR
jgi:6,7-dimethyl-8-ribityllumazine synthase